MAPIAGNYDAFLVACFSAHPSTAALHEEVCAPVVGIMETGLYAGRMLGGRFGIVITDVRSSVMLEDGLSDQGLVGCLWAAK